MTLSSETNRLNRGLVLCAILLSVVLSGCGSLPHSGPVQISDGALPPEGRSTQTAPLPRKGSKPLDVIRGFMAACAAGATINDFEAARQYLLPAPQHSWEPEKTVRVYANDQAPQLALQDDNTEAQLGISALGQLNESGEFVGSLPGGQVVGTFKFAKNDEGEWRISELPEGITISRGTFEASYQRLPVFFLSPDMSILIPDVRWVPKSKTTTYLTQYLLDGPTDTLGKAVATALPEGTTLPSRTVVVENGQAIVNLNVSVPVSSAQAQSLVQWQMDATLSQLPSVTSVKVTLNDQLITVSPPAGPAFSGTEVLKVVNNEIRTMSGDRVLLSEKLANNEGLQINSITHGPVKGSPIAFLSGADSLWIFVEGQNPKKILTDTQLSAPSIDYEGWIWVSTAQGGVLTAIKPNGDMLKVPTNYTRERLQNFVVSADGTHAIAFRAGENPTIDLVKINRNLAGQPRSVDLNASFPLPKGVVAMPAWSSTITAAALVRDVGSGETEVWKLPLGGLPEKEPGISQARRFVATIGTRRWFAVTDDNILYQLDGRHWIPLAEDVSDVAASG